MTPIQTNKPVFFNSDGEPLNGKIYIGQPNTDPRTSPKTVTFRDAGGVEFTASQPLNTVDGRVVYNGLPIEALVSGEHSMLTLDSAGVQIDYSPTVAVAGSADRVQGATKVGLTLGDTKAIDVSVGDTVQNIGIESPEDYDGKLWLVISATGAPGDDVTLIDFDNGLQGREVKTYVRLENLDPSLVAKEIKDGSFSPSTPTLVWSGSTSAGVAMSSLSEFGAGWYVLKDDTDNAYQLYVLDLATDGIGGGSFFTGGFSRQAYFRRTDDKFFIFEYNSDTGAFVANVTVTAIYKV